MKNKNIFWEAEESPKQIYKELILFENPKASFWDIFKNYEPIYTTSESADTSKEWLQKQKDIIKHIISKYLTKIKLNWEGIALLTEALVEYLLPEEDQDTECLSPKLKHIAQTIAKEEILPLKLTQNTTDALIDALEDELERHNKDHILDSKKEEMHQLIKNSFPKETVEKTIENFDLAYLTHLKESEEPEEDDDFEEEPVVKINDFEYPTYPLAYSTTFFGFDDGGNLTYERQEQFAREKFKQYEAEICDLLNLTPDTNLLPKSFVDYNNDEDWVKFSRLCEENPFMLVFHGDFTIWKNDNKVLFLSMSKEDKELPYDISIGGLTLHKYAEMLSMYNNITKSK